MKWLQAKFKCGNMAADLSYMVAILTQIREHCSYFDEDGCRLPLNTETISLNMRACLHVNKKSCNHALESDVYVPVRGSHLQPSHEIKCTCSHLRPASATMPLWKQNMFASSNLKYHHTMKSGAHVPISALSLLRKLQNTSRCQCTIREKTKNSTANCIQVYNCLTWRLKQGILVYNEMQMGHLRADLLKDVTIIPQKHKIVPCKAVNC